MSEQELTLEQLYNQSVKDIKEGQIVKGRIAAVKNNEAFIDVGFKSEGVVPVHEFSKDELKVGSEIDVLIESVEDDLGMIILSRDKAMRMQGWDKIVKNSQDGELADGRITKKVKGGFLVNVQGIEGFLPASLSGFKGTAEKDIINNVFKFKIIKVNNLRRSIILSRREAVQKEREEI
ncbi:MAG: S1 RNA-binding domain-containing protein, partial [Candidatus Omnitrophota bacterium]